MLFEKPAKKVAREIVRERWKRVIAQHPEFKNYERELERLFTVEPYLERKLLHRAAMELLVTPEGELGRIKKKYMLTDEELKKIRRYRELARKKSFLTALQDLKGVLEGHEGLKTLGARVQLLHKSGLTQPLHGKVHLSADEETIYHELAHAIVPAYLMRVMRIGPGAARIMSAIIPPHEDEAFAFAVSHHYLGLEPDDVFFQWVEKKYGEKMDKWDQKSFERKYWVYRKVLKENGLHAALKVHVGV